VDMQQIVLKRGFSIEALENVLQIYSDINVLFLNETGTHIIVVPPGDW
jgi:hypothetical protein